MEQMHILSLLYDLNKYWLLIILKLILIFTIMVMFLKLSFTIINLSCIKQIDIQPNKYNIYLNDNEFKGSYNILKLGDLSSKSSKIHIQMII